MSGSGTLRGLAWAAGFLLIHPQRTAWFSARWMIPWIRRTVAGANGRPFRPPLERSSPEQNVKVKGLELVDRTVTNLADHGDVQEPACLQRGLRAEVLLGIARAIPRAAR